MVGKSFLLACIVGALAFAAAGCGGDDKGGGGGEPLTKPEFISQADAICKKYEEKGESIKPEGLPSDFDPTSPNATDEQLDKFGDFIEEVVDVFRGEVDELRDLTPPADFQTDYNRALELLDETGNEYEEASEAAHDADRDKIKEKLEEADRHSNDANKIAKDYGLKVCGAS